MQNTTYFHYNLPETDDRAQVSYLNSNFTNLDATLHNAIGENYNNQNNLDSRVTTLENGHTYSTTEQVVGTWVDGKPVYEKTILIGNVARNNNVSVSSGISNIDKVIELKGFGEQIADNSSWADYNTPQGFIPIPNYRSTSYYCGIAISSSNNIGINLTSDYQRLDNCYAIIRYTKSTDITT